MDDTKPLSRPKLDAFVMKDCPSTWLVTALKQDLFPWTQSRVMSQNHTVQGHFQICEVRKIDKSNTCKNVQM